MDKTDIELIGKVFLFSLVLSAVIKYGGPLLYFSNSNSNALIAISLPPLVILIMLLKRGFDSKRDHTPQDNQ